MNTDKIIKKLYNRIEILECSKMMYNGLYKN